ncbi:MAG: protein-tyrosine kinase [Lachnospiraceae bacterium]|nr:protein-tyrosine kinase [Lachnospiraceae bacterium]
MDAKKYRETEEEKEIDLMEIAAYLHHWLWLILVVGLACGAAAFAVSAFVLKPIYVSTTKIYVLNRNSQSDNLTYADTQLSTLLTKDFKELITSRYVLETVINELELEESYEKLAKKITVSNTNDTRIIGINVEDYDPARAQYIANAVREVAAVHIQKVMDIEAVNVVDEANLPTIPSKPSKKKITAIGILVGMALVCGILVLRYYLDDSLNTSEDVEKYLGITTIAVIPVMQPEEIDDLSVKNKKK